MKKFINSILKKTTNLLMGAVVILTFASCEYFDLDVQELLVEKLDNAAIQELDIPTPEEINKRSDSTTNVYSENLNEDDLVCISCMNDPNYTPYNNQYSDRSYYGSIRNPRNFNLKASYTLRDGSSITSSSTYSANNNLYSSITLTSDVTFRMISSSSNNLRLYFSGDFLHERELDLSKRDITGDITLYDDDTGRTFDPFEVKLRVNTPPPSVYNAMLQREGDAERYVLCFQMPKCEDICDVHFDTHVLDINGTQYYFSSNSFTGQIYNDASRTQLNNSFTTTRPTNLRAIVNGGETYPTGSNTNYVTIYYYTNVATTEEIKTWSIKLIDDEGLSSTVTKATNNKLSTPWFETGTASNTSHAVDDSGYYVINVYHNGKYINGDTASVTAHLTVLNESGNEVGTSAYCTSTTATDSSSKAWQIKLPKGTYYRIKFYVTSSDGASSEAIYIDNTTITQPPVLYVSESFEYSAERGTKGAPFRSIYYAVSYFNNYYTETNCTIYILDDLTDYQWIWGESSKTYTIAGYGANKTIDANDRSYVLSVSGNVILKDLTLTGASGGGGLQISNNATVTVNDCIIKDNNSNDGNSYNIYGGISIGSNATVTLNNVTVKDNTASDSYSVGGIYFPSSATLNIKGNTIITNNRVVTSSVNKLSNLVIPSSGTVHITGALATTSRIGVTTASDPEESGTSGAVTFTSGFSTNNPSLSAGTVFSSDKGHAVITTSSGEAALALSGGSFSGGVSISDLYVHLTNTLPVSGSINTIFTGTTNNLYIQLRSSSANGTVVSPSYITGVSLFCGTTSISGVTHTIEDNAVKVTIPSTVSDPNRYTLYVDVLYNGLTYQAPFILTGVQVPQGFVGVYGHTIATSNITYPDSIFSSGNRYITIPNMFVSDHEVTQSEYLSVIGTNPSNFQSSPATGEDQGNRPVERVSWYDAIVYCNTKSISEGLTPCYTISNSTNPDSWGAVPETSNTTWNAVSYNSLANGYRLPTEAEWEYLARGGNSLTLTQTTYSGSDNVGTVAWYSDNSGEKTHEVKKKTPNALGIYDMCGNITEWCWDWKGTVTGDTPATGQNSGTERVLRGGCFGSNTNPTDQGTNLLTVYRRDSVSPATRTENSIGFRVVRNVN